MGKNKLNPQTSFSEFLHKKMSLTKTAQSAIAGSTGISRPRLGRWFSGEHVPPVKDIPALASALKASPLEMLMVLLQQEWKEVSSSQLGEVPDAVLRLFNVESSFELSEEDLEALLRLQKDLRRPMTLAFMLEFLHLRKL